MFKYTKFLGSFILSVLLIAGCGGGGDSAPANVPAQGFYWGATGDGRVAFGTILDSGGYYFLYSAQGSTTMAGVVQGSGSATDTTFSSGNARDFNLEWGQVYTATVNASYVKKQSISATIKYADGSTNTFDGTYDPDYENTPLLSSLVGPFNGSVVGSSGTEAASVTVNANGSLTGNTASGCSVTGSVSPRAKGNVFNITINTTVAGGCASNSTYSGMAYYDVARRLLLVMAPNGARDDGVLYVGKN